MLKRKLIGTLLIILGIVGLGLKLFELEFITTGCFGYNYIYEFLSVVIPIVLLLIGVKVYSN